MPRDPFAHGYFRLHRDPRNAIVWGICAGIAEYFGVSRLLVRLVVLAGLIFFTAPTLVAYVIARLVLSPRPADLYDDEQEARFWRDARVEPRGTLQDLVARMRSVDARLRDAEAYVTSGSFRLRRAFEDLERRG